jgi:hypothetical protein
MNAGPRGAYWPDGDQELLLRAALLAGEDAVEAWRNLRPRLDVDRANRASRRLFPLLDANLRRHGIDDPVMVELAKVREQTASRNRALFDAARGLLQALEDARIDTLVLKGGAVAARLYRDLSLRPMADIDVLVPTGQAQSALDVLQRADWSPGIAITPAFIRMQHATDVFAESGSVKCDLHWHVYWECCQPTADDDLWASSLPLDFSGMATRTLAPADALLHLCVHGSRRVRHPQLLWVADALLLLRESAVDWRRLMAQAIQRRFVLRAGAMLAYLRRAFGAPVPDDVLRRLQTHPVSRFERFEYWLGNRPQGLVGELPIYWCNYRRLREGWPTRTPPGFTRYLQQTWRVESLWEVGWGALARGGKRVRAVFR